jgi:hypothetical protein
MAPFYVKTEEFKARQPLQCMVINIKAMLARPVLLGYGLIR